MSSASRLSIILRPPIGITFIRTSPWEMSFSERTQTSSGSPSPTIPSRPVRCAQKAAFCREMGADHAIDYRSEDFVAEVARITGRRGVDVILDMVGGDYIEKNLKCLAVEGRLVLIAFLRGGRVECDWRPIMMKRLTVTGSTLRASPKARKAAIAKALEERVWPLYASGRIRTVIHATFPLAEAAAAHTLMESSAHIGKIVLEVAG